MKKYSLLFFILFFSFLNPRVSVAEPGFFFQTLTNSFVDWVFGQLDSYIQDKSDESNETQDEKIPPKAGVPSEKKVSILVGDLLDGKKVGNWIEYYLSGIKKSEGQFANGKKDGPWLYYFLNANIKEKQFFIDGHKDGLWEKFDVHGTVVQTESYQNGKWIITTIN